MMLSRIKDRCHGKARGLNAPINVNPVGGSAEKGRGFDAWDYPRCRAFDRAKRPRGRDI